ncbi:MAG: hypothetical protein ABEJ86_08640, partial [Halococcoides sp.]
MNSVIRYALSLGVGLIVTVAVATIASTDDLIILSLFPLYVTASSMIIAHRQTLISLTRQTPSRKRGAIVGGVSAFTGGLLLPERQAQSPVLNESFENR